MGLGAQRKFTVYGAMLLTAGSLGLRLVQMAFQVYLRGHGRSGIGTDAAD